MHPQTREQLLSGVADLKYRPKLSACILAGARSLVFDWAALLRSDCIHVHPDLSNVLAFDATDRLCV